MKRSFLIFLLLAAMPAGILHAQQGSPSFVFTHVLKTGSLQEKYINTIFQDSRGFLWLGTRKGVCRYDGLNFKYYNTLGPTGISDWVITCIEEDKKGNIWIGTESGLNKLDPFTEHITQYYSGTGAGTIPYNWCNTLFVDSRKDLWLATEKGLALYDEKNNSFINYPVQLFDKDERINKFVRNIAEDKKGDLWMSTSHGLKKFNVTDRRFTSYYREPTGNKPADNVFYSVFIDHNGIVWAGTFAGDLLRFDPVNSRFEQVTPSQYSRAGTVYDISEIKPGNDHFLVLATVEGLFYKENNETNGDFHFSRQLGKKEMLYTFIDKQQHVWLGSTDGLYKLNSYSLAFNWYTLPAPALNEVIYHIIPVHDNKNEFYLTTINGWYRYNALSGSITKENIPGSSDHLLEYINNWQTDQDGYWFSSVSGFGYYDAVHNKLIDLSAIVRQYTGRAGTGYIAEVSPGKYWVSIQRSGILEYDAITGQHRHLFADGNDPDRLYGYDISYMTKHNDGYVYVVARKKLYRINPADLSYKTYSPGADNNATANKTYPLRLLITPDNRILVISDLKIYMLENEQLVPYYPKNGLLQYPADRIINADSGYWMFSDQQVFKISSQWQQWQNIQQVLGWSDSIDIRDINISLPGKTIFAARGAVGLLDNKALLQNRAPNKIIASTVRGGKKEIFLAAENSLLKPAFKDGIEIELSPVDFNEANRIYYRLRGWNDEWTELRNASTIRYEQLPPGHYTFEARSVTAAGIESDVTALRIRVIPPFYRSWWFITLAIISVAATVYLIYRYKLRKAIEMERMRTRIATDLHDDIGATLSSISMYSESVKKQVKEQMPHLEPVLNKMGENSREMVTSMSDIVWAINPVNDDGDKLIKKMENYARDICAIQDIQLQFTADEKLNEMKFPLEHRKNIYLVFKEALNNALKYAGASQIAVSFSRNGKGLKLIIKDNGKGFDTIHVPGGNGLKNMKQRAAEINASLDIRSEQQKGTEVSLSCDI